MSALFHLSAPWWVFVLRATAIYALVMVLVRVSGTEPKIRVMVEGQDLDAIHRCADRIVDKINKRILGQ